MGAYHNLAREEYRRIEDLSVQQELLAAGIPILKLPSYMNTEVKTHFVGQLNGFLFSRGWRYWVCEGDIEISHADRIYDEMSHLGVRANGDARNIRPTGYNPAYQKALSDRAAELGKQGCTTQELLAELELIKEDLNSPRYVGIYHIDTTEGLKALAQFIRANSICAQTHDPQMITEIDATPEF